MDSTFYMRSSEGTVLRWAESTPASFRFACKLPRAITHACRLRDCSAEFNAFLRAMEPLAPKLQVILDAIAAFVCAEGMAGLPLQRSFLEQLPREFRFAIEFRHPGLASATDHPAAGKTSRLLGLGRHQPA